MENRAYKILVLSDLRKTTETILKNTANLANMIGGDIAMLHVKQPLGVVKQENQLSAVRSINDTYTSTKKHIQQLVQPIQEAYGVKIDTSFKVGNIKELINKKIEAYHPDIIVLGQRKSSRFNFLGDGIVKHIMSKFEGLVMIASHEHSMNANKDLSLAVINGNPDSLKIELMDKLMKWTTKPLKSFKIATGENAASKDGQLKKGVVEYTFQPQDNVINNMSSYLSRTNVDLLFVDFADAAKANINVKNVIGKFNVPFLLAGNRKAQRTTTL